MNTHLRIVIVGVALVLVVGGYNVYGQTLAGGNEKPSFEVASVKQNKTEADPSISSSRGRYTATNIALKSLIMGAFDVRDFQLSGGPQWIGIDRFDINATANGEPTAKRIQAMIQSLLEERFALATHKEVKDLPAYRLILAKDHLGPRFTKTTFDCGSLQPIVQPSSSRPQAAPGSEATLAPPCTVRLSAGRLLAGSMPLANFLVALQSIVRGVIIDGTGLTGTFDVDLEWSTQSSDTSRPSIFTALKEQLGLKLESTRARMDVLVIDHVEHPTPD